MPTPTPKDLSLPPNRPRISREWFQTYCERAYKGLQMTGFFRNWLTHHFSNPLLIDQATNANGYPSALVQRQWNPDDKKTQILIESVTQWKPTNTEMRPSLVIKRNSWKRVRLGIDDRHMGNIARDAQNRYTNVWQGSHTIFCIAGDGGECELLASEVYIELNTFGPVVRKFIDLMRYEVMEVGEIMKLAQEGRENFVVPVTVGYAARQDWTIDEEAPKLKRFVLNMNRFQV